MSETPSRSRSRQAAMGLLILALVASLAWGISQLFSLRFARGDVYPPYSTLRADPLGCKALAEAFAELPGFKVERNYRPLAQLKPRPVTIVYAGLRPRDEIDEAEFAQLDRMITQGARVIFAFLPEFTVAKPAIAPATPVIGPVQKTRATPQPGSAFRIPSDKPEFMEAAERWGVRFNVLQEKKRSAYQDTAEPTEAMPDGDPSVRWHSALYFVTSDSRWQTLYRSGNESVIIERAYGAGSIVLCSDAYFLSNEGLRAARAPRLIARLLGEPRTIVFDEVHHGVAEHMNVAGLMRKHNLGGVVLALLGVVLLFLWKTLTPFLPSRIAVDAEGGHVVGRDASEGFINLLRRSVPARGLLAICAQQWEKACGRRLREEERAHVGAVLRAHESRTGSRDIAAAYRAIVEGLNRHR